jgi:hypothetical protein
MRAPSEKHTLATAQHPSAHEATASAPPARPAHAPPQPHLVRWTLYTCSPSTASLCTTKSASTAATGRGESGARPRVQPSAAPRPARTRHPRGAVSAHAQATAAAEGRGFLACHRRSTRRAARARSFSACPACPAHATASAPAGPCPCLRTSTEQAKVITTNQRFLSFYGLDKMSTRWAFTGTRRNALLLTTLVFAWCVPPPGARAFCRLDKATQRHCVTCA